MPQGFGAGFGSFGSSESSTNSPRRNTGEQGFPFPEGFAAKFGQTGSSTAGTPFSTATSGDFGAFRSWAAPQGTAAGSKPASPAQDGRTPFVFPGSAPSQPSSFPTGTPEASGSQPSSQAPSAPDSRGASNSAAPKQQEVPQGFAAGFGPSVSSQPFKGAPSATAASGTKGTPFRFPAAPQSSADAEGAHVPFAFSWTPPSQESSFQAGAPEVSGSRAAGTPFTAATSGAFGAFAFPAAPQGSAAGSKPASTRADGRAPFTFPGAAASPQSSFPAGPPASAGSTAGSPPASQGGDGHTPFSFAWAPPPCTAPAGQQSSFQNATPRASGTQPFSFGVQPASQPSSPLPNPFAAVFGTARAAPDAPLAGAPPAANHSTPSTTQAAPSPNGPEAPQSSAPPAFGASRQDPKKAFGAGGNGQIYINLTAAAGRRPIETGSRKAAGTAAHAQPSGTPSSPAAGFAAPPAGGPGFSPAASINTPAGGGTFPGVSVPLLASNPPPAASGSPPAANGTPPAVSDTRPAASGIPPAVRGTPPAAYVTPLVVSSTPSVASSTPPAVSGNLRPTEGAAAEQRAPAFGAADLGGSAFTSEPHTAPLPSWSGVPMRTPETSVPHPGGLPTANPFAGLHSTFFDTPTPFTSFDVPSGQVDRPFAFSQQTAASADAVRHVPEPFSFGSGVGSAFQSGVSQCHDGEDPVKAAGQQAGAGQPTFGLDTQVAAANGTSGPNYTRS